jgi:hypothetical protein
VTIALQNLRPFTYPSVAATESVSDCDPLDTAGYIEVRCEHMNADTLLSSPTTHILDCPTGKERRYTFTCPKYDFKPQCSIWDDVTQAYTVRDNCRVTAYDSMSSTCECDVDGVVANSARRRLDLGESGQSESVTISSTTSGEEDGEFVSNYEDADEEDAEVPAEDEDSAVILAAGGLAGVFILAGAYLLAKKYVFDPEGEANEKSRKLSGDRNSGAVQPLDVAEGSNMEEIPVVAVVPGGVELGTDSNTHAGAHIHHEVHHHHSDNSPADKQHPVHSDKHPAHRENRERHSHKTVAPV